MKILQIKKKEEKLRKEKVARYFFKRLNP